jgi:hypothetical protein
VNRYALFAGDNYYPSGGFQDFRGTFSELESATDFAKKSEEDYDWWHVVDLTDGTVVESGTGSTYR